jgi:hypothetical protein
MRKLGLLVAIFLSAIAVPSDAQTFGSRLYPWRTMGFDSTYIPGQVITKDVVTAPRVRVGTSASSQCGSAALQVSDTAKGVLLSRVTNSQMNAINSPCNGLLVYNTTDSAFYYYKANQWVKVGGAGLQNLQSVLNTGNDASDVSIELNNTNESSSSILNGRFFRTEKNNRVYYVNSDGLYFNDPNNNTTSNYWSSGLEFIDEGNPELSFSSGIYSSYFRMTDSFNYMIKSPRSPKGSNVYYLPDTSGTIALKSDIPVSQIAPKKYIALLSQTGTNAPVATVLYNNTGASVSYVREGIGGYKAVLSSSVLTSNKTIVKIQSVRDENNYAGIYELTNNSVSFFTVDGTVSNADNLLGYGSFIEILIYP